MDLRKRLEILFNNKGVQGVDMDALMADFDVIRPFLRGAPLAIAATRAPSSPKRDILKALKNAEKGISELLGSRYAKEAVAEVCKREGAIIQNMSDLQRLLVELLPNLQVAINWVGTGYNPKGGAAEKYSHDIPYLIALFKTHVDGVPSATPSGLFSEFVSVILSDVDPGLDASDMRSFIQAALLDTRNIVDLGKLRSMDPNTQKQIAQHPAKGRNLILPYHPQMLDWAEFLKTYDVNRAEKSS